MPSSSVHLTSSLIVCGGSFVGQEAGGATRPVLREDRAQPDRSFAPTCLNPARAGDIRSSLPDLTWRGALDRRLGVCVRRQNGGVQFSPDLRDRVADGTITISYRLWSRPKVKVGGVYRSCSVMMEVDEIAR